ncbi:TIGR03943 family protein, partial [Enterococcus faecium]|nr:TIGR03943 family protein [Enterococcus faecium]
YQPFKRDLPMVVADQEKTIEAPENQYVYRAF